MEGFGERLKKLMRSAGLNETSMALLLDISSQRLENIITGYSNADIDIAMRVAEIFGVSYEYAAAISEDPEIKEPGFAKEILVAEKVDPVSGLVKLDDVVGSAYIDREKMHGKEYFGFIMNDDGMKKARIFKGDTVIVRRQNFAANGDVVMAIVDEKDVLVRRYSRMGNVAILTAEGDGLVYKPVKVDTTETKFNIVGRITEVKIFF